MPSETDASEDATGLRNEPRSRPRFAPSMERLRYWHVAGETIKIWAAIVGGIVAGLLALLEVVMLLVG